MRLLGSVLAFGAALVSVSHAAGLAELAAQIPPCGVSKHTETCVIQKAHSIDSCYAWRPLYQRLLVLSRIRHVYVPTLPYSHLPLLV